MRRTRGESLAGSVLHDAHHGSSRGSPERKNPGMIRPEEMTHKQAFTELLDSIGINKVIAEGQTLASKLGESKPIGEIKRVAEVAKHATLEKLDPLKNVAHKIADPLAKISQEELRRAEQRLRERFGGYDDSMSQEKERQRQLAKYMAVFEALADRKMGGVPINDLEDLFAQAGLAVARTEVGQLSYEADSDGNGSLDFGEFCVVLDRLSEYHKHKQHGIMLPNAKGSFLFGTEGASLPMREVVWRTLEDPTFSRMSRVVGSILFSSIALAIIVYVLQSEPAIELQNRTVFRVLEIVCLVVFMFEYLVKLATCPSYRSYLLSVGHAIDAGTLLPYFIDLAIASMVPGGVGNNAALRVLRVVRVFRIFKVAKYVPYVSLMATSAAASAAPIMMAVFVMLIGMILLAFAVYFTERGQWNEATQLYEQEDGTTSPFQSIADASYWAVVTLTSVGYGDLVPASAQGKLVGAVTAMAGYIIVAFPVSIYTEEFSKEYVELVKVKALQAELGGDDLCDRLLVARKKALSGPQLRTFPVGTTLTDVLSPSVPRNLAMTRRARRLKLDRMTDALLRGAEIADMDALGQLEDVQPAKGVSEVSRQPVTNPQALDPVAFSAIWHTPFVPGSAAPATSGQSLGQPDSVGPPVLPVPLSVSPAVPRAGRRASVSRSGSASAARRGRRNSLLADTTSNGQTLAAMFASSETGLRAASFAHLDLSQDSAVKEAMLALISDKRKQVWGQVRLLESRMRDDVSTELARRWQHWMGMPAGYVADLARPYVFRAKDLTRSLGFMRSDLAVGFVRKGKARGGQSHVADASSRSGKDGGQRSTSVDTRELERAGRKIAGNLRSLVTAPSKEAAQAVLQATGQASLMAVGAGVALTRAAAEKGKAAALAGVEKAKGTFAHAREKMAEEVAQMVVPLDEREKEDPRNYQARLASQYSDALAIGGVTPLPGASGSAGGRRQRDLAPGKSSPPADGSDSGLVQTAFGMSAVLPQNLTGKISSSVATGMASIAGGEKLQSHALVGEYKEFWTRHFVAPLQSEDGEQVVFAAPDGGTAEKDSAQLL